MYIDIHTHGKGEGMCLVDLGNEWEKQAGGGESAYYSAGIHPMLLGERGGEPKGREWLAGRLAVLEGMVAEGKVAAVGEAGLDRRAGVSMEWQAEVFEWQAEVAARQGVPLVVHAVRAAGELAGIAGRRKGRGDRWIVHGFNSRMEVLQAYLRHGFWISVGRQVLQEVSHARQLLPEIPLERLFLETDGAEVPIGEVYAGAATRLGMGVEELQEAVRINFSRMFGL